MQSDPIHVHEEILGWMLTLCTACHEVVGYSQSAESGPILAATVVLPKLGLRREKVFMLPLR
jgi:hypothetical protein